MSQDLLDALPDGVVIAGPDGTVTHANVVARQMLDVAEPVGLPLDGVLRLQDPEGRSWTDVNLPFEGLPSRTGVPEQAWLLPDGTEVLTAARIAQGDRISRGDRTVTSVAVTLRSGRGRARLDRDRSDLVATVAHELRSPLTGVKGFVQALLNRWDRLSDEQKKLMLTTAHADADRLSRLITELLDVARIDTGRLQLHPRPSDAAVLVRRVVDSVQTATARPVDLRIDDGLPQITVDPDKFAQVVTNVVENAVRHGEGMVTIAVRALAEEPGVRITVDDEGEGIPAELRRRVFTKFWKGGASAGSGLGLYIVGGLTRAHGGDVTIQDAPSGGARVVLTWPQELRRPG